MKTVYLDMNIFNRPFDDQSVFRIKLETSCVFAILQAILNKELELLWSFILDYENSLNPYKDIQTKIKMMSSMAGRNIEANEIILQKAKRFEQKGIKARDALHVASAAYGGADYFITCDDGILRKTATMHLGMKALNPVDFARQWEMI